mgnify:CR=1 FL=1
MPKNVSHLHDPTKGENQTIQINIWKKSSKASRKESNPTLYLQTIQSSKEIIMQLIQYWNETWKKNEYNVEMKHKRTNDAINFS